MIRVSNAPTKYFAKDFVETYDGFFFAVLFDAAQDDRVICFPRYVREDSDSGCTIKKVDPQTALSKIPRKYLFRCEEFDQVLAGVETNDIRRLHCATLRAKQLMENQNDELERITNELLETLGEQIRSPLNHTGVTGSLLIGVHNQYSDIDVVSRERNEFELIRKAFMALREEQPFTSAFWRDYYQRTSQELSLEEFIWHEERKNNRLNWKGRKVDLSLSLPETHSGIRVRSRKIRKVQERAKVIADTQAFDYPAIWEIEHELAEQLVCWDPRYSGQAVLGEEIEFGAWLEVFEGGGSQFLVGSSREASGEYIRVCRH